MSNSAKEIVSPTISSVIEGKNSFISNWMKAVFFAVNVIEPVSHVAGVFPLIDIYFH